MDCMYLCDLSLRRGGHATHPSSGDDEVATPVAGILLLFLFIPVLGIYRRNAVGAVLVLVDKYVS